MSKLLTQSIRTFLEEPRFAVLATIDADGLPQQSVIWYELSADDEIVMNTKRGRRKDRNLVRDGRCSVCLEDGYRWITLSGSVTLIDDQSVAQADIERIATRYGGAERAAEQMRDQFSKEERVTLRVRIERVVSEGFE